MNVGPERSGNPVVSDRLRNIPDTSLVSFDGTETTRGRLAAPDRYRRLFEILGRMGPCIARGAGLIQPLMDGLDQYSTLD